METNVLMEKGTVSRKRKGATSQAKRKKTAAEIAVDQAIGERIRHVRVDIADLDQRSFATKLGVSPPAVAQWELGKGVTRANLDRIVTEFGVSRDWLHTGNARPIASRIVTVMHMLPPDRFDQIASFVEFHAMQAGISVQEQEPGNARKHNGTNGHEG
jgi:transcriptional regulator with XRE-family HTH domain